MGTVRKHFLGVFADFNSGFRTGTDSIGNAPAEQIDHLLKGGRGGTRAERAEKCSLIASTSPAGETVLLLQGHHEPLHLLTHPHPAPAPESGVYGRRPINSLFLGHSS